MKEDYKTLAEKMRKKAEFLNASADSALHEGFKSYIDSQKATIASAEDVVEKTISDLDSDAKERLGKSLRSCSIALKKCFDEEGIKL